MNKTVVASVGVLALLVFGLAYFHLLSTIPAEPIVAITEVIVAPILIVTVFVESLDFCRTTGEACQATR